MKLDIERVNNYGDKRFSAEILKQHGAFVINGTIPCEVEIIGRQEAVIRGNVQEYYGEIMEEFRFYAEHICKFYNEEHQLIKEFEPVKLFTVSISKIQPSQFYVDVDKMEAVQSFITSPEDIVIPLTEKDGRYISLDGHTRLAVAVELGFEEVTGFVTSASEYIFAFAEEAKKRNVNSSYDLQRLSHAEYQILWHDFCDDFFQRKKKAYPTRVEAEKLLREAEGCNPGPWGKHSRIAAGCAEKIAALCDDMDSEKAYVVGLLHDIGRKFGVKHLGHVYDGYHYMRDLGYGDVARICLTHSFSIPDLSCYIGNRDIPLEQQEEINQLLHATVYDDYDLLIQLCDALAGADAVLDMEERMADVKRRYGSYPREKWERNLYLRKYFEEKTGQDLYEIVRTSKK